VKISGASPRRLIYSASSQIQQASSNSTFWTFEKISRTEQTRVANFPDVGIRRGTFDQPVVTSWHGIGIRSEEKESSTETTANPSAD